MRTVIKKALPLLAVVALPLPLFAAPTVTFQGEVTDQTCEVQVNGHTDSVVLLPTVSFLDFGTQLATGQSAGQTPFTVSVKNCQAPTAGPASITTNFLGYNVDSTGVLGNSYSGTDAAAGFGIQLMDSGSGGTEIRLSGVTPGKGLCLSVVQTEASYASGARYFVTDAAHATAGKSTGTADYTPSYL